MSDLVMQFGHVAVALGREELRKCSTGWRSEIEGVTKRLSRHT